MNDQRAGVADIGQMREQFHIGHQLHAGVVAALETDGQHRAAALRRIFFGERVIFVAGETRIAHPGHLRPLRQPFGNGERVVGMALHAQRQRLDAGDRSEERRVGKECR